jgi:hypothetical protein
MRSSKSPIWLVRRYLIFCATILIFLSVVQALSAPGQVVLKHKPWIEKDWTQWTKDDCSTVLGLSPWAYSWSNTANLPPNQLQYGLQYARGVELRSALPMREALLRQLQLDKNYDKMKPEKKEAFDKDHADDLVEKEDDPILVWVDHSAWNPAPDAGSNRADQALVHPVAARQAALLLPDGGYLTPLRTTLIENSTFRNVVLYTFPRVVNGKPAFASDNFRITIVHGDLLPTNKGKEFGPLQPQDFHLAPGGDGIGASFNLGDLIYKGKPEY